MTISSQPSALPHALAATGTSRNRLFGLKLALRRRFRYMRDAMGSLLRINASPQHLPRRLRRRTELSTLKRGGAYYMSQGVGRLGVPMAKMKILYYHATSAPPDDDRGADSPPTFKDARREGLSITAADKCAMKCAMRPADYFRRFASGTPQ